ncbi:hypothetical protein [Klebsiella aerogenes]|uniref:hypothetical protein n=1 Tax=Klebsiella aerogenes TaxID=548 RepID=UPI001BD6D43D|nr:hypothetical protein [Klebsiella aerogenes]
MKFNIQYLHAAVVLVLAGIQPQPKAAECQPLIVEKVTQMGATFNHKDILEVTIALNDLVRQLRDARMQLSNFASANLEKAIVVSETTKNDAAHMAALTDSLVVMLPEKRIILSYSKNSPEFMLFKAVKQMDNEAKNYISLIEQLTHKTEVRDSGINSAAVAHLAKTGEEAARKWL